MIPWAIARQRAHAARCDHHAAGPERPAGDPGGEVGVVMVDHAARVERRRRPPGRIARPERDGEPELLAEDLGSARADRQVDRPPGAAESAEQSRRRKGRRWPRSSPARVGPR